MKHVKRKIGIFGSTGSIGTQTLDVLNDFSETFEVSFLTAHNNAQLLIDQCKKYQPQVAVIVNEAKYAQVKDALQRESIEVLTGKDALDDIARESDADIVVTGLVGFSGLSSTVAAIKSGKAIALSNKETLVVAGSIIMDLAKRHNVPIIPVDSEHSAIFQCLVGESYNTIDKIILTASGGPFRGKTRKELQAITKKDALKHPNWDMGAKITIDSSTLMNKGLEVIEAKWLFDLSASQIDVVVHPESIIHSLVQFNDSSIKAQLGLPDMKLPIHYALQYPNRVKTNFEKFNFMNYPRLNFQEPDFETFRNLQLAFDAMHIGGNAPCVLNAANEVVVAAFLKDKVSFLQMSDVVEECLNKVDFIGSPTLEDLFACDEKTRVIAENIIE